MIQLKNKKMPIELVRYIEFLLRNYPRIVQHLNELKDKLTSNKKTSQLKVLEHKDLFISNPIAEDIRIERLETIVQAINRVITQISSSNDQSYLKFIQLKYWNKHEELTMDGIALKIHVSRRTVYNIRTRILYAIARELGEWH
jgi:RinA family phage transcriptional activator